MKWHYLVAAACLGALAWFRFQDQSPVWGLLFLALAAMYLIWFVNPLLSPSGRREVERAKGQGKNKRGSRPRVTVEELLAYQKKYGKSSRGWLVLTLLALALMIGGVVWYPPLAVVMGATGIYCAWQFKQVRRALHMIKEGLDTLGYKPSAGAQ